MAHAPEIAADRAPAASSLRSPEIVPAVLAPSDHLEADELIERAMRPGAAVPLVLEAPLLLGRNAASTRLVTRCGARLASHVATFVHDYQFQGLTPVDGLDAGRTLRVGVVGAVATDPEFRGRGHATALLREALRRLRLAAVDLAVLWADDPAIYHRVGFRRAGREILHVLTAEQARALAPRRPYARLVRPMLPTDLSGLMALHAEERSGTLRPERSWRALLRIPRTRVFVIRRGTEVLAYGVVGKGLDLEGCLHEWGGDEALLPDLAAGILRFEHRPLLHVMSAPWKHTAARAMAACGFAPRMGALGMVRVLDPVALVARLRLRGIISRSRSAAHAHAFATSDPTALAPLLLGTPDQGDAEDPDDAPPVPFYLTGLDSM